MAATASTQTKLNIVAWHPTESAGGVEIDALAREAGMHPDLVRRFIRLGLLEPLRLPPGGGRELFPRDAAATLARATRLRRDLGLNYAGAVLACELLARIDELEARLRRYEPPDDRRR